MLPLFYQRGYDPIDWKASQRRARERTLQVLRQRNIDGVVLFGFTVYPRRYDAVERQTGDAGA